MNYKEIKNEVKKLSKEKKYNEIFTRFGTDWYLKYTPKKYKKHDIEQLRKQKKYIEAYIKYGYIEDKNSNSKQLIKYDSSLKSEVKYIVKNVLMSLAAFSFTMSGTNNVKTVIEADKEIESNADKYKDAIDSYNNKLEKRAEKIREQNLSDIEIFMKVMNDMHQNIKGYAEPQYDIKRI